MKLITLGNLKSFWKDVKSYVDNGLSKKADSSHGTHVSYGTINGKAPGTPSAGTSSKVAREDHVHPVQTTVSGNAGSATKLATARTINGTSFDGSGNITTANWGTARNIQIGNTSKSVNGSANVSWSLSEIGAAAASHGKHVPDTCTSISDWNAATTTGWYMGNNATNSPTANAWYFGEVIAHNTNYVVQTVYQFTASTDAKAMPKYIRAKMNGTWGAWTNVTVAKAVPSNAVFTDTNTWRGVQDNLTSTATDQSLSANQGKVLKGLIDGKAASNHTHSYLPLSGGTMTGGIKFSGGGYNNHAIRMEAGDSNGAFIGIGAGGLTVIGSGESMSVVRDNITNGSDETMIVASDQTIRFLTGVQNGYSSAKEVSINASGVINAPQGMTGNASTATKLQTVRTINGTNFDGSANITTANWGTARTITVGNTGKSVNGSGNVSWSLSEIGAASTAAATTSSNGLMTSSMVSTLNTASSRASDWNTFKSSGGKINGNIAIPNGSAIAGPNGSAIGFASGGETVVSSQGDGAGWLYFRPNGFTNPEGQAILRNDGVFELSNNLKVKDAQIGIQHSVEAVFKSFNHNKGLYINQNNIGFFDWGKNKNLFCINSKDRTASIDTDNLFFGSYSLSHHGYTKLPNGLILQWGFVDMSIDQDSMVTQQVTLPVVYSNKILSCFANAMWNNTNNSTGWTDNLITQCSTNAKSNITIVVRNLSRTSGLKTYKINWMTLGY